MKPKKTNDPSDKMRTTTKEGNIVARPGYKMGLLPKKGELTTKQIEVMGAKTMANNGIYAPLPVTQAKAPTAKPTKSNWKAPTSKQTGMKKAMKVGGKGKKC